MPVAIVQRGSAGFTIWVVPAPHGGSNIVGLIVSYNVNGAFGGTVITNAGSSAEGK
jgi:hypothetical protein